jgi:hypothetical protein
MSLPLLLLFAVAAIGLSMFALYSLIYAGFIAYARARRKGYHSVGASLVIGVSGIGWLAVFIVALAWANSLTFASSLTLALASPFFGIAMMFLIVWLLPRRQVRVFGPRRGGRTLVIAGWIAALGGGIPTMLVLLFVMPTVESIRDVFLAGGLLCCGALFWFFPGYVLVRVGKTAERQPRLEAVLTKDVRPPILYLRPFGRERQPFVTGDSAKYGAYYRGYGRPNPRVPVFIPLESYLAESIWQDIGPFVALGSPEDFVQPVAAAARKYSTDATWQQDFDTLARSAAAILVEVGNSSNLTWEFQHIRHNGWQERLILLTQHSSSRVVKHPLMWPWIRRLMGFTTPSWSELSGTLKGLGYDLDPTDPGLGAVVSFNANGCGIVLTTTADLPADYIDAIRSRVIPLSPEQC